MTDAFAAYAETAAPTPMDPRANRRKKDPSAFDLKMEEKGRLHKRYKAMKRQERIEILAAEPRLLNFMRYLRGVGADQADEFLDALATCDWLLSASQSVRLFALGRIQRREDKIRLMLGEKPMDDPLPTSLGGPSEATVYFKARALLATAGPL